MIIVRTPATQPTLKLRTISAESGSANLEVDDFLGRRSTVSTNATKGVVKAAIPTLANSPSWIRHVRLVDAHGAASDYYVAFLAGILSTTNVVEQPTNGGAAVQLTAKELGTRVSFIATAGDAKLTFAPVTGTTIRLNGTINLVRPQDGDLSASVPTGPSSPAITLHFDGLDPTQPAAKLSATGTFSTNAPFGMLTITNPHLLVGDVPLITADVGVKLPGIATFTAAGMSLDSKRGLALGCDGLLQFDASAPPVASITSGLLSGFALTPSAGRPRCDAASNVVGFSFDGTARLPSWLTTAPNAVPPIRFSVEVGKDHIGLAPGTTIPIVPVNQKIVAGPVTLQFTAFTLQNDSKGNLQLALGGLAIMPGAQTVTFPTLTVSFAGGTVTADCPTAPPAAGFSLTAECSGGTFNGFKASGAITIPELGANLTATNFSVGSDGSKIKVTGVLGGTNSNEIKLDIGGADVRIPPNKMSLVIEDASPAVSIEQATAKMPAASARILGESLTLKGGKYDFASKMLKIASLTPSGSALRGFSVDSASDITADFTSGAKTLRIGALSMKLSDSVKDRTPKTVIDENGGVHDESDETLVKINLTSLQLSEGRFTLGSGDVTPEKSCPAEPAAAAVPLPNALGASPVTSPAKTPASKADLQKYYYHLGWVDVCFDQQTKLHVERTRSGDDDWVLNLGGNVRLRKVLDDTAILVPFQGSYRVGTFAVRADFSDAGDMHMGGETVHVGVVSFTLAPALRHLDAEVSVQAHELHDSTFYFRHVGLEQRYELVPHGFKRQYDWRTYPVVDPDLARTGTSLASRYIPALLGFLAVKHW
jgi:hypothetical protein